VSLDGALPLEAAYGVIQDLTYDPIEIGHLIAACTYLFGCGDSTSGGQLRQQRFKQLVLLLEYGFVVVGHAVERARLVSASR